MIHKMFKKCTKHLVNRGRSSVQNVRKSVRYVHKINNSVRAFVMLIANISDNEINNNNINIF